MSVLQFPCSATPVCSRPSHLWIASDSLWSVHPGRSVCPAELWARKVRGASSHWTKFKWIKTEKKNRERRFQAQSEMSQRVAFLYESLPNWFCFWWTLMIFRRLPCGVVREELHSALPVWNHGWKIHHGTQLHLHQWMLQHTPVQRSCKACYALLDWHITHTAYFILSLVNRASSVEEN